MAQLREMVGYKLVARLLATAALWVRIQTSLKKTLVAFLDDLHSHWSLSYSMTSVMERGGCDF